MVFSLQVSRGMEQASGAPSTKALHSVLRISPGTLGDIPARVMATRPSQKNLASRKKDCNQAQGFTARIGDLHMCAPDIIRSARCLLRDCPDGGHANDQLKFPDRNAMIQ